MSKKNKAKFKKHLKAQILQEINREVNLPQTPQILKAIQTPVPTTIPQASAATAAIAYDSTIVNLPQIKYDLKKTAIIILILAIIIGVLSYLDQKYNILIELGNWLFKFLNIK